MNNTKISLILAMVTASFAAAVWVIASGVEEKPVLPRGVSPETTKEQLDDLIDQWSEEARPSARAGSRIETDETTTDLGIIDPQSPVVHQFTLTNIGTATLVLGDPQADGDGVTAAFSQREISPGGQAQLTVRCVPFIESGAYVTEVKLPTSDPDQPTVRFKLKGQVQRRLEADPASIVFPDIDPHDQPQPRETFVFSKVWDAFEIVESSCDLAGVQYHIEPATAEQLADKGAKSGYRIEATLPPELPSGLHRALLKMKIQPEDESGEPLATQLHLSGKILRRLCIYGDEIDKHGVIDLGQVRRGAERRVVLRVKVRDPELAELPEPRIETEPSFVHVELTPYPQEQDMPGWYRLEIVIPDNAPVCSYLRAGAFGSIRILTDHPRIPEQTLQLRMAVTPGRAAGA